MMLKRIKSLVGVGIFTAGLLTLMVGIATVPSSVAESHRHSSVTGYFGLDDDGFPVVDRHGIMLVFDGAIASETVSVNTFEVSLNDGSFGDVVETRVDGPYVFVRLKDELASDATPIVGIAEGEELEDLAGNSTNRRKLGFVQIEDGIAPRLTVMLSGGSGRGTGDEGPNRLTKDTIDIRVTSDEPLQGAPRVIVVCEKISWTESVDSRDVERDIDDFIANRGGAFPNKPHEPRDTRYTCGYDADGDGIDDAFQLTEDIAHSRPGEVWEYTWRNPTGKTASLRDGRLVVVAYGRDKSRYERYGKDVSNWGVATGGFGLDTEFEGVGVPNGVKVHPEDGSETKESRPFVLIQFPETEAVTLKSVIFDGVEVSDEIQDLGDNRFLYWPMSINRGQHTVDVGARDAAGNDFEFDFSFESVGRGDFVLELHSGWNAISVPSNPINPSVGAVFTDPSISTVIGWINGTWHLAVRRGEVWGSNPHFEALSTVSKEFGYWVKSTEDVRQAISLRGPPNSRAAEEVFRYLPTAKPGWNFVGIIDLTRIQTENHFRETLLDGKGGAVRAREYLGDYDIAFTWDPVYRRFEPLLPDDLMIIGNGVWVYYSEMGNE